MKAFVLAVVATAMMASGIAPANAEPVSPARAVTTVGGAAQPNEFICYVTCLLAGYCCK